MARPAPLLSRTRGTPPQSTACGCRTPALAPSGDTRRARRDRGTSIPEENSKGYPPPRIPIATEAGAALATLAKRKLAEGSPGWVFWNAPAKAPYNANSVTATIQRIATKLKIKTTFHATRVTFMTDARESVKIGE